MPRLMHQIFDRTPPQQAHDCDSFLMPCNIGIEIELENYEYEEGDWDFDHWNRVYDGSLRNCGIEFVFNGPKSGTEIIDALVELENHLENHQVQSSHRTSVHVHVDFSCDTRDTVENFYLLCMLFEPTLYSIGNKQRYNNIYCPGLTHATTQIVDASLLLLCERSLSRASNVSKYSGINLNSLHRFNTVELRNHEGTTTVSNLIPYLKALIALKYLALHLPTQLIHQGTQQEIMDYLPDVFPLLETEALVEFGENARRNRDYYLVCQEVAIREPITAPRPSRPDQSLTRMVNNLNLAS